MAKTYTKYSLPVWIWDIYFFYDLPYEMAFSVIRGKPPETQEEKHPGEDMCSALTIFSPTERKLGVWLSKQVELDTSVVGLIAHEALHATFHIAEQVGMRYTDGSSEEAYCYLHQDIVSFLISQAGKKIKGPRQKKGKRGKKK